jgi:hypothetical protein
MPVGSKFNLAICSFTGVRALSNMGFHSGSVQNVVGIHPTVSGEQPETPEGTLLNKIAISMHILTRTRLQGTDVEGICSFSSTSCGNP